MRRRPDMPGSLRTEPYTVVVDNGCGMSGRSTVGDHDEMTRAGANPKVGPRPMSMGTRGVSR